MNKKFNLILASKSPRRNELLGHMGLPFEIVTVNTAEKSDIIDPSEMACDIASKKGDAVFFEVQKRSRYGEDFYPFIVAADTIVVLGQKIYGKPKNLDEAKSTLISLSGNTHKVITGVYVKMLRPDGQVKSFSFFCETDVTFFNIKDDLLKVYLKTGESMDKAGAYGIQGAGLTFIEKISGSYSNVVGFPLSHFIEELNSLLGPDWRDLFNGNSQNS